MEVYAGIDLHANNNCLGVVDAHGKRIYRKKLPNDPELILGALDSLGSEVEGVVVESTFNWYWLVDLLQMRAIRFTLPIRQLSSDTVV